MVLILQFKYIMLLKKAGYPIAHLDNTNTRKERDFILKWFKKNTQCNYNIGKYINNRF